MDRSVERRYEAIARSVLVTTPPREKALSALITGPDKQARDAAILELVSGNMRLVLNLTRKYRSMRDYGDIMFDGNLGLVKAASTFDCRLGKFSTWATPKIRTEIREGIYQRTSGLSSLRSASEVLDRAEKAGRTNDAVLVRLAMMDSIPLYDDDGKAIEVPDPSHEDASAALHRGDLLGLVHRAASELGLSDDDLSLVSEANEKASQGEAVAAISKKLGITKSAVRMMRAKLVWMIRKKILGYVGKDEYLILSAFGSLPSKRWKR